MALVRRLLGDAQAKLRKMVDDNLQVATRADCDLATDRPEPADPLITPATESSMTLSDGICRPPSGSPSRPPSSHNDRSKFYSAPYLENDKKAAIALDRKINFSNTLSNSNGRNNSDRSINGNDSHYNTDSLPGTSKSSRLSLCNKQNSRNSFPDRSSCSAINEIENETLNDGFDIIEVETTINGKPESPAMNHHQNGGDRNSYAEIIVPMSKYADRNILDAESSDEDIVPSENGSGTSPRATETGTQENDDTSGRSGSGRECSALLPGDCDVDNDDRRRVGSGSICGGSIGGISPAPASPRTITPADAARRLKHENERLKGEAARLRRLLVAAAERGEAGAALLAGNNPSTPDPPPPEGSDAARIRTLETELRMAREAVIALKADRKRLKAEKFDLLNQMKQLYASLEDKERELRDFIRNYEQARRQLQAGGWVSDQDSLGSLPRQGGALTPGGSASGGLLGPTLGLALAPGDRGSCSADSGVRVTGSSDRESAATSIGGNLSDSTTDGTPTITLGGDALDMDSISVVSSIQQSHLYHLPVTTPKDCSPTLSPHNSNPFSRSLENNGLSRSVEQLSGLGEREVVTRTRGRSAVGGGPGVVVGTGARSGRGPSAWGSISRVFARSRHRNKPPSVGPHDCESLYDCRGGWPGQNMNQIQGPGPGAEAALREAASLPLERWRAPAVRAWLDIALGMPPQYGAKCAENIKSGKVLLELTDAELENGLGIAHPMHRKKLRLAIEEHRNPDLVRHPAISQLGHEWVTSEWLPDLGLSQYAESFAINLVDARMLDNLSKKELEKYLGVTRKFHQASIVHGIHLLRLMKYDRQALALRRHQCETIDADPLVWTNQRFMRWARNIDLAEYADNLKDSGVHGGLVVLEPSFTGDTMATALGVPPARAIIRRHLSQQLDALVLPARNALGALPARRMRPTSGFGTGSSGTSGRTHWKSLAGLEVADMAAKNIKGSITRALGLKPKQDKTSPSSSSESSSIMSRWGKPSPPRTRSHLSIGHPSIGRPSSSLEYDDSTYESPQSIYDSPSSYNPSHLSFRVSSQQSINSNIYSNGSQCFDISELGGVSHRTYSQRSVNSHRVSSPLPVHEEIDSSYKQTRHRRVRSIGDIEAASILPT